MNDEQKSSESKIPSGSKSPSESKTTSGSQIQSVSKTPSEQTQQSEESSGANLGGSSSGTFTGTQTKTTKAISGKKKSDGSFLEISQEGDQLTTVKTTDTSETKSGKYVTETTETKKGTESSAGKKVEIYKKDWLSSVPDEKKSGYLTSAEAKGESKHAKGSASGGLGYWNVGASSELSYDLDEKTATLDVINAQVKGSVVHAEAEGEFDLGGWLFGSSKDEEQPAETPSGVSSPSGPGMSAAAGAGRPAARVTDPTTHGSPLIPGIGSPNVIIGFLPAWRTIVDFHACPVVKGVVPDVGGVIQLGSPTVFINNQMACRIGDIVVEVPGGPNPVAMGCPTVLIGDTGGGGGGAGAGAPAAADKKDDPSLKVKGKAEGDLLTVEADAKLGVEVSKDKVEATAKAGAMAAAAKGSIEGAIEIPIPFTDHVIILGGKAEGSALSAGVEAEASAGWSEEEGYHASFGFGAALGFGGSLEFTIGFK